MLTCLIHVVRKAIRLWKSLSQEAQLEIRQALLQSLSCEKENLVKHSVMEIIGGIAKLELAADKSWPELMNVIKQGLQASVLKEKEVFDTNSCYFVFTITCIYLVRCRVAENHLLFVCRIFCW